MVRHGPSQEALVQQVVKYLESNGYSSSIFSHYRGTVRRFLAFVDRRGTDITAAEVSHLDSFLEAERRRFRRRFGREPHAGGWRAHRTAPVHLLFRLARGDWPPAMTPETPRERFCHALCDGYRRWMLEVRGVSVLTFDKDWYTASRLLDWLGDRADAASLRGLTPQDLDAFLVWRCCGLRRATRSGVCQGLRSFLRYLHVAGFIERDLAICVTSPPHYWNESLPSAFTEPQVKTILGAARADRTAVGRRDYAILLMFATYGLRAGEITRLRLEDIDWRREQFRITQSKNGRSSHLPLTTPVGEAILDYLRHVRPTSEHREVFLSVRAPHRPFACGSSLTTTVHRRVRRAGVEVVGKHGCHAFRFARAVSLLRAAVPLKAISDLLGHSASRSTDAYLKLATEDLRDVGLELPTEATL